VTDIRFDSSAELRRAIRGMPAVIELAVLGSFSADQTHGLERLLAERTVDEAVAPLLGPEERLIAAAQALVREELDEAHLAFLAAPGAWLLRHGVSRVTFVSGSDDGRPLEARDRPDSEGWTRPRRPMFGEPEAAGWVPCGSRLNLNVDASDGFTLAPLLQSACRARSQHFLEQVARSYGSVPRNLLSMLTSRKERRRLKDIYEDVLGDDRLAFLNHYIGPAPSPSTVNLPILDEDCSGSALTGWLMLLGADVRTRSTRDQLSYFDEFESLVGTTVQPNGGATGAEPWPDRAQYSPLDLR
jgi:hypothetical protein